jgi:transcriptional regulator with XRE-family HTH domain
MQIQTALVNRLKELGIKQRAIMDAAGMSQGAVSQSMMLKRKFTLDEYSDICRLLGVSMDEFRPEETGRR